MNFYVDGTYLASSPPSSILWDSTSVPDGTHTLSISGFDSSSNVVGAASVVVIVANVSDTPTPTVIATSTPTPAPTSTPTAAPTKGTATPTAAPSASATPINDPQRPSNDIPNNTHGVRPRN